MIIVPISGGKDSMMCLILAIKQVGVGLVHAVFNDTGWEHEITYEYLDRISNLLGITIHRTIGGGDTKTLEELIIKRGQFPFGRGRFCTSHLKQRALRDYYKTIYKPEDTNEIWFGMRTAESSQRSKKYSQQNSTDVYDADILFPGVYNRKLRATFTIKLPILDLRTEEVFDYLKNNNIEVNPLYNEGTNDRVGCYPCMLASKNKQMKMLATPFGQKRLEQIKILEVKIGEKYEMLNTDDIPCKLCDM